MKTTKRPYTLVRVMDMLTEIKILCKRNLFTPKSYSEKEPSIWHFVRVLVAKGVLSKINGTYKWIGGEPNFEMSKVVTEQVQAYGKAKTKESLLRKKNTQKFSDSLNATNIMESLDVQEIEYPKEDTIQKGENIFKEIPMTIQERMTDYYSLSKELELKNSQLEEQILAIKKELEDYEFQISDLLKENENLKHQIHEIFGKKSKSLNQKVEEIKTLPIEIEKPAPRKVKLLGITILKIE
jgi:hypothetical protein